MSNFDLATIRHSAAHVMAAAVKQLYPDAKFDIGPATDNGFYYDFDVEKPFSESDFEVIEKKMQEIVTFSSHNFLHKIQFNPLQLRATPRTETLSLPQNYPDKI